MSRVDFGKFVKNRLAALVSFDNTGTDLLSSEMQAAIVELSNRHFGKDAGLKEKAVSETTTGNSFSNYDTLSFNVSDETGINKYRCAVNCLYGHNSASNDIRFRLNLDNGDKIIEARVEPKDSGSDQNIPGIIVFEALNLSEGVHSLSLEYRPATSSRVSRMKFSLIEAWRIF